MDRPVNPNQVALHLWLDRSDSEKLLVRSAPFELGRNHLVDDANQGFLSVGPPDYAFRPASTFDDHVFWFPRGIPSRASMLLASSRIGHQPDSRSGIFDAIRTLACRFDFDQSFLISQAGIATDRFVARAAELFDVPLMEFRQFPTEINSAWFQDVLNSNGRKLLCYYGTLSGSTESIDADGLLIALSTELRLLSVRPGGRIAGSALTRLAVGNAGSGSRTLLLMDASLTGKKLTEQLLEAGALPWWLYREDAEELPEGPRWPRDAIGLAQFAAENRLSEYLIHWTRRRTGPWPDQTDHQFLDDLILGLPSSDHSRLAALRRIVATKQLLANNQITRDSTPVVCFCDCAVNELATRRQFRPHLSRWDFELFGIAVKRDLLVDRGAMPVVYGDNQTWETMEPSQRPYFQMAQSETSTGVIDWTEEREWRLIGNLDLSQIPANDAFVFVETKQDAERVAPLSHWPVVVLAACIEN